MANLIVRRANDAFKKGDYQNAKSLYQQAAEQYGVQLFNTNIKLCEYRINNPGIARSVTLPKSVAESSEVLILKEKIKKLNQQLKEKDANINERFKELAILTRILEEKDAQKSSSSAH